MSAVLRVKSEIATSLVQLARPGVGLLVVMLILSGMFFLPGVDALLEAWQLPEYSHGPLIPVLSGLLFLRQLKTVPVQEGPINDRWIGVAVVALAIVVAALGRLSNIDDLVAYGLIIWTGGVLLISFGWKTGKHFWPGVLHLVYMLPLPGVVYYKMTTVLQFISSELGVWFLQLMAIPVYLDGNIIDLGVLKLHVAEACSGLRYLFPILSFSYVFAVLYRGPMWHKALLLIAAAPITIFMNSVRIAVAGVLVQYFGNDWLEGFSHFFEGWVIFALCIAMLFGLAWLLLRLNKDKMSLVEALDLDTSGLWPQAMRVQYVRASTALITATVLVLGSVLAFQAVPERGATETVRDQFSLFPRRLGDWQQAGPRQFLDLQVEQVLAADDYHQVDFVNPDATAPVSLFMAWYQDQSKNGVHSPEICLPGAGWEIAWLERTDITAEMNSDTPFKINRAIIQQGTTRMMVYYWFEQKERRVAWDFAAKFWLMVDGIKTGQTDGALVRMTTPISAGETDEAAEERLKDMLDELIEPLPRFVPSGV